MGLKERIGQLAAPAPIPWFAAAGAGGDAYLDALRADARLVHVGTPRAAMVTVGAGVVPEELLEPLSRIHDGMPHPRALAWLLTDDDFPAPPLRGLAMVLPPHADGIARLVRELRDGRRPSSPPLLADIDPAEWRGVGPYGQGGSGMTGGVPYGRPMASLAPDRDGLRLDRLPTSVGPWFPFLPPGLRLRVGFAGDVLSGVEVLPPPPVPGPRSDADVFHRALREPVPISVLELARVRSHLCALARALDAAGLAALARGVRRLMVDPQLGPARVDGLERRLRWSGFLGWHTSGVGRIDPDRLGGKALGPIARAAGLPEDARDAVPAYLDAGFTPAVETGSDAASRWRLRLREVRASLELARMAHDRTVGPLDAVESPRGTISTARPRPAALELVPQLLDGLEWGDALTTLVSLDLGDNAFARPHPDLAQAVP